MLSKDLEFTLNQAFARAREEQHEFITVEHLLLALIDNPSAARVLKACAVDCERLREEIGLFLTETSPRLPADSARESQPTLGFQRVLQRAVFHVQSSGKEEVSGANVLVAIFSEQESQAVYLLAEQDVQRLDVVNFISHGVSKSDDGEEGEDLLPGAGDEEPEGRVANPLQAFASDLNEQARAG
ncbi:MAG: ATP-dependent Clp protease ATP-binding subunit ClpA, partial [Candidatus Sedimenticola endophacoides]